MWVAKDKDGYLSAYHHKPLRGDSEWGASEEDSYYVYKENGETWYGIDISIPLSDADYKAFEFLKWEDEPIEVSIVPISFSMNR